MTEIDQELFEAWKSNDNAARQAAWERLWKTLYEGVAFPFCRRFCGDDQTAAQRATDALTKTLIELNERVLDGRFTWQGEPEFFAYARRRLILRCQTESNPFRAKFKQVSLDAAGDPSEETGFQLLELFGITTKSAEEEVLAVLNIRDTIRQVIIAISACKRDHKTPPSVIETLDIILDYLRLCLMEANPKTKAGASTKADVPSLDKLLETADLLSFDIEWKQMYEYFRERKISGNALYLRMRRTRALLESLVEHGSGATDHE